MNVRERENNSQDIGFSVHQSLYTSLIFILSPLPFSVALSFLWYCSAIHCMPSPPWNPALRPGYKPLPTSSLVFSPEPPEPSTLLLPKSHLYLLFYFSRSSTSSHWIKASYILYLFLWIILRYRPLGLPILYKSSTDLSSWPEQFLKSMISYSCSSVFTIPSQSLFPFRCSSIY